MPASDLDTDLDGERAHLTASRAALRRMRERAEALFTTGDNVAGDAYTAETLGRTLARRVAELADDPTTPLFFGRLDFGADAARGPRRPPLPHRPPARHRRRRRADGARLAGAGVPVVLPGQRPRPAGRRGPAPVRLRAPATLTSFEDEHLDRGEELGTASRILTAEIERPRVGPMRDIVATIQPEQDELVRADLDDSICVQGAPGTGKTAVGLHRAAYLLYLHRERLRRSGVLIVGPNRAFLHYIAAVLPALGEVEVEQSTVDDLIAARAGPRPTDAAGRRGGQARRPDGDRARDRALARASAGRPSRSTVPDGSYRWRIGAEALRRIVDDVRREAPAVRHRPRAGPGPGGRAAAAPGRGAPRRLARRRLAAPDGRGQAGRRASSTRSGRRSRRSGAGRAPVLDRPGRSRRAHRRGAATLIRWAKPPAVAQVGPLDRRRRGARSTRPPG